MAIWLKGIMYCLGVLALAFILTSATLFWLSFIESLGGSVPRTASKTAAPAASGIPPQDLQPIRRRLQSPVRFLQSPRKLLPPYHLRFPPPFLRRLLPPPQLRFLPPSPRNFPSAKCDRGGINSRPSSYWGCDHRSTTAGGAWFLWWSSQRGLDSPLRDRHYANSRHRMVCPATINGMSKPKRGFSHRTRKNNRCKSGY